MISFFSSGVYQTKPDSQLSLKDFLDKTKNGTWAQIVLKYRDLLAKDKAAAKKMKLKVPNLTISGTFSECADEKLIKHSGFVAMDVDNFSDSQKIELIKKDIYTYACFKSISGNGICIIVKINPEKHVDSYNSLIYYYKSTYDIICDSKASNLSRRRIVSYDPDLFINENSLTFDPSILNNFNKNNDKFEILKNWVSDNRVDLTFNYSDWIRVGLALRSGGYGESDFHFFSQFCTKYKREDCSKKWQQLCKASVRNVTMGSLFWLAKKAGFDMPKSSTGAGSAQRAAATNNKPQPVQQVSGQQDGKKDNFIENLENFIKDKHIFYNEIRDVYEFDDGREFTDRDLNTLYLECKKKFGKKVTKTDVASIVESGATESINPIKRWLDSKKYVKSQYKTGYMIEQLASCIEFVRDKEDLKQDNWLEYFLKKWFVGFYENLFGGNCPLIFVLCDSEGNKGKTEFFLRLLPDPLKDYATNSTLDHEPIRTLSHNWLVFDDEFGGKSKQESRTLKMLTSTKQTRLRGAYQKHFKTYKRLAMLAGSSNEYEVITDISTNNRRIIPVNVISINWDKYNKIDKEELFLDAYRLYQSGFSSYLSKEDLEFLQQNTTDNVHLNSEYELISKYVEPCEISFVTATDIKIALEKNTMQRLSLRHIGLAMQKIGFKKISKRVNGRVVKGYYARVDNF